MTLVQYFIADSSLFTMKQETEKLIDFIYHSPSPFHAVESVSQMLTAAGFEELCLRERWQLKQGAKYFTRRNGSAIIAFTVGDSPAASGARIVVAHTDSPTFRLKPDALVTSYGMPKLNVETYGGAILHTWMDRPLGIAGRVAVRSSDPLHPRKLLVDFHRPVCVIPSVAIHFNRGVNENLSLNKQIDMPPLVGMNGAVLSSTSLMDMIAAEAGVADSADILDYDLNLYDTERGNIVGLDESLVLCPRLDDLQMVYAAVRALIDTDTPSVTKVVALFDNEEVGSNTKQGAASPLLVNVLERLAENLGLDAQDRQRMLYNSFLISADSAHALHPNHPELHDPVLHPVLNGGPVIKVNASQKYMTDGDSGAVFAAICEKAGVPYQRFVNRSDMAGGSTLGNILTSQIDIRGVDIGAPLLGMHSARETGGVADTTYTRQALEAFFAE